MLIALLLLAGRGEAQNVDMTFTWAPSPVIDQTGIPHSAAVIYEVFLQRDGQAAESIATVVADTTFTLAAEPGVVQRICVRGYDDKGRPSKTSEWSEPVYFDNSRGAQAPPERPELAPCFPNPFNPETHIAYGIPADLDADARLSLEIYSLGGRRVRTFEVDSAPGWHEITWDGTDDRGVVQATGIYFSRFICGQEVETHKMTMIK